MLKINTTNDVEENGDVLGGFKIFESDAYETIVKALYFGTWKSGAQYAGIILTTSDGGEYRETITYTNAAGENYYKDKRSGKNKEMPGFQTVNELCLMTTGIGLMDHINAGNIEEKVLKLWDSEAKAETNQSVPVAVEVIGKPVVAGIIKQIVNKQVKGTVDGKETYVDGPEKREENQISKFFHAETQGTATEYLKDAKLGTFFEEWINKNKGNTINRYKEVKDGAAPGRPGQAGGASGGPATQSLFNRK